MSASKLDWTTADERFLVCIREGRGVVQKEGSASDVFVEVKEADDKKSKTLLETKIIKKEMNPVWNQLLFIPKRPEGMMFRCWADAAVGRDFVGQVSLNIELQSTSEVVKADWFNLGMRDKDLKKDKQRYGEILLSWVSSSHPINRSLLSPDYKYYLWYQHYVSKFETGDILLYSGTSIVDNTIKVLTGSNYSNIGFILKKHNKWTNQPELYVVECANSGSTALDALSDTNRSGVAVYKLLERIHQYHGDAIWWGQMATTPSNDTIRAATEYLLEVHEKRPLLDYKEKPSRKPAKDEEEIFVSPALLDSAVSFWSANMSDAKRDPSQFHQVYAPQLVAKTLQRMGLGWNCNFASVTVADVANLDVYKNGLTLIRCNEVSKEGYLAKQPKTKLAKEFKAGKSSSNFAAKNPSEASFTAQKEQLDLFQSMINWKPGKALPIGFGAESSPVAKVKKAKTTLKKTNSSGKGKGRDLAKDKSK